jgi:hypothetical protein
MAGGGSRKGFDVEGALPPTLLERKDRNPPFSEIRWVRFVPATQRWLMAPSRRRR